MAIVKLSHITYTYPLLSEQAVKPALKDVSLTVERGEMVAVLGENEAGKSTLCYAAAGLIPHYFNGTLSGSVQVCGLDVLNTPRGELVQRVGLVLQNPFNQISGARFSVAEEIAFGLENLGVPRPEMKARVATVMAQLHIEHLAGRSPLALSGGQLQRVAIASVLAMRPEVLVLDEPTSQLDPPGSEAVMRLLAELKGSGMSILITEHRLEWVTELADRVVVLQAGQVVLQGTPAEVFNSPDLPAAHINPPPVTRLARAARERGLWPLERRLPVTLEDARQGFVASGAGMMKREGDVDLY